MRVLACLIGSHFELTWSVPIICKPGSKQVTFQSQQKYKSLDDRPQGQLRVAETVNVKSANTKGL